MECWGIPITPILQYSITHSSVTPLLHHPNPLPSPPRSRLQRFHGELNTAGPGWDSARLTAADRRAAVFVGGFFSSAYVCESKRLKLSQRDPNSSLRVLDLYLALASKPPHSHRYHRLRSFNPLFQGAKGRLAIGSQKTPDHPGGFANRFYFPQHRRYLLLFSLAP